MKRIKAECLEQTIHALLPVGLQQDVVDNGGGHNAQLGQEAARAQRQDGFQVLPAGDEVGGLHPGRWAGGSPA